MTDVVGVTTTLIEGPAPSVMPPGYDLAALGYLEEEHLLEGRATSYRLVGDRTADGRWSAEVGDTAPFRTRVLVRRPADAARFSGTVAVEWMNVSAGVDIGPDWTYLHRHLLRRGDAWVGVSAQKAGIDGGGFAEGFPLKVLDADRYGVLDHPGDRFAFDIFSTAGRVVRAGGAGSPTGELQATQVVAIGESQSAMYLTSYVNAVDPSAAVFDGFLVHGRGARGAPLDVAGATTRDDIGDVLSATVGERIRDDARVPVLVLQSETDLIVLGGRAARQESAGRVVYWEVAGAAHADTYVLSASNSDDGSLPPEVFARRMRPVTELFGMPTGRPVNAGPQQHYVGHAAYDHLVRWSGGGAPPPPAPPLDLETGAADFARDADGIATGGLRTPWVDVPIEALSGVGQSGESFAFLFGTTEALPTPLAEHYPGGRDEYLAAFTTSLDRCIADGYILAVDRDEIIAVAAATFDRVTRS